MTSAAKGADDPLLSNPMTTAKPLAMTFAQANYERRLAQLEGRLPYRKKSSASLTKP